MSGLTSVELRKPDGTFPSGYTGPISDVAAYTIQRQINQAGTWSARFPVLDPASLRVATGWRATLKQAGNDPDLNPPDVLMYRGKVSRHRFVLDAAGGAQLEIAGFTTLGVLGEKLTHLGQLFENKGLGQIAAGLAPTTTIHVPSRTVTQLSTITINDQTVLAALLKMNDPYRVALRERFDSTDLDYIDQDDIPLPTSLPSGVDEYLFTNTENVGPELIGIMKSDGIGLISGVPLIAYEGTNIINKIRPVGVDYDGAPLLLNPATSVYDSMYDVQTGTNPNSTPYYFLADQDSIDEYGEVETQLVRSDIKNPSNDPTTKADAQLLLFAVASTVLLQRRSEVLSFSTSLANGDECWALPGDRIRVKYRGIAKTPEGVFSFANVDQNMVVVGRTDTGNTDGVRSVQFDLAAMVLSRALPALPNAVPIPIPDPRDVSREDPQDPDSNDDPQDDKTEDEAVDGGPLGDGGSMPAGDFTGPALADLPDRLEDILHNNGPYEPCCPDQTTDNHRTDTDPPSGAVPKKGTLPHWVSTGFDAGHPQRCAAVAVGDTVGGTDVTTQLLGSATFVHGAGNSSLDNSGPFSVNIWGVIVTGPAPNVTGASSIEWFAANADINPSIISFQPGISSAESSHPYVGKSDPFDLNPNAGTLTLADNKEAYSAGGGNSFLNVSGGAQTGAGIGPGGPFPFSPTMTCTQDNSIPPHVTFWIYQFAVVCRIS